MSDSEEATFDMDAGYKNKELINQKSEVKPSRIRRGRNIRKDTEDISNSEYEDGLDEQMIGDDEDVKHLDSLNDYDRELELQRRHKEREEKKQKIVAERRIGKAKRLEDEAKEKADFSQKIDRIKNSELKELLNKRSKIAKRTRDDSDEEYGYSKSHRKDKDDDEDFRGSSAERDEPYQSKRLKTEKGSKGHFKDIGTKTQFSMNPSNLEKEKEREENQRQINSGDWKKVNQICLKRHELLKWSSHLNFDELIKDCLVMINMNNKNTNIQKKYCICKIKYVLEKDDYYNVDNTKDTNKYLMVENDGFEQEFKIRFVSNTDVDEMRQKHWLDDINKRNETPITQKDIESKLTMIKANQNQRYTATTIGEHVQKKLGDDLTQPSLGPGKKVQKQLHPQEKLHILGNSLILNVQINSFKS